MAAMSEDAERAAVETLARQVEAHPDFRVVRRLDPARSVAPLAGVRVSAVGLLIL